MTSPCAILEKTACLNTKRTGAGEILSFGRKLVWGLNGEYE